MNKKTTTTPTPTTNALFEGMKLIQAKKKGGGTEATRKRIEYLYLGKNLTQKAVAEHLGLSTVTVSKYCQKYGMTKRDRRLSLTYLTYKELEILYVVCNLTAAAIAKLYQINIHTLKAYIQDSGIKKQKKYR